jgi:outer membrane assembly lipoprotein YfiO
MRLQNLPRTAILISLAPFLLAGAAPKTSELHGGRWIDVTDPTTQEVDQSLLRIEDLLQSGRYEEARKSAINWVKYNKGSPLYDRGLYLVAEALYQYGDRIKAFYYLDQLMDQYPESSLYYQALEKQYQIADGFLSGYKTRFLKIPMFSATEEAIEMMFRIQQRSPGSPLAEKALLRTADYYYANADYDLAELAYGRYVENYPRSPTTPRVKLRQAYSNLAQFRGLKFDVTPVIDAKAQLEGIVAQHPDLAAEENIPSVIDRIDRTFARKLEVTADFYKRTNEPRAAAYTYQYLAKNYPESVEGMKASQYLDRTGISVPTTQQTTP